MTKRLHNICAVSIDARYRSTQLWDSTRREALDLMEQWITEWAENNTPIVCVVIAATKTTARHPDTGEWLELEPETVIYDVNHMRARIRTTDPTV